MKKKKKKRRKQEMAKLEMTPMIDVVFQLLIFFIVTLKVEDILAHLDVDRPAPDPSTTKEEQVQDLVNIMVYEHGLVFQGRKIQLAGLSPRQKENKLARLDYKLTKLASYSKNISIIIRCDSESPHVYLVDLLNICAKAGLKNLSVFSF